MTTVKTNKTEALFPSVSSDFFGNDDFFSNRWLEKEFNRSLPAVNIKEKNDGFDIEFAAPGFNKSDFKINVKGNILTVNAEVQKEKNEESESFTRREFSCNSFSRSFTLPKTVNSEKILAKYNDGILKLQVPKKEEEKQLPKKEIKIS